MKKTCLSLQLLLLLALSCSVYTALSVKNGLPANSYLFQNQKFELDLSQIFDLSQVNPPATFTSNVGEVHSRDTVYLEFSSVSSNKVLYSKRFNNNLIVSIVDGN